MARQSAAQAAPTAPELSAILAELKATVERDIAALRLKLPEGAGAELDKVAAVIRDALATVNPETLKQALMADLMLLIQSGKGPAPHDPSELA